MSGQCLAIRCHSEKEAARLLQAWSRAAAARFQSDPGSRLLLVCNEAGAHGEGTERLWELGRRFLSWEERKPPNQGRSRLYYFHVDQPAAEMIAPRLRFLEQLEPAVYADEAMARRLLGRGGWEKIAAYPGLHRFRGAADEAATPLFGRQAELQALRRFAREQGGMMLLEGEIGIGKSALLETFAAELRGPQCTVLWLPFSSLDPLPYQPYRRAVEKALREWATPACPAAEIRRQLLARFDDPVQNSVVRSLFGGEEGPIPFLMYRPDQSGELVEEVIGSAIIELSRFSRLFLVMDDLHQASAANRSLLKSLQLRLAKSPLHLLVGARSGWREQWGEPSPPALSLAPLDEVSLKQLANAFLKVQRIDEALFRQLHEGCQGNPLYAREWLALLRQRGQLALGEGAAFKKPEGIAPLMPPSRARMISSRLDELAPWQRTLLQIAALAKRPLTLAEYQKVARHFEFVPSAVPDLLRDLQKDGLLRNVGGSWSLIHDLLRQDINRRLRQRDARRVHLALSQTLYSRRRTLQAILSLSDHCAGAGQTRLALYWGIRGARQLTQKGSVTEAYERWSSLESLARKGMNADSCLPHLLLSRRIKLALYLGKFTEADLSLRRGLAATSGCRCHCRLSIFIHHLNYLFLNSEQDELFKLGPKYLREAKSWKGGEIFAARLMARLAWAHIRYGEKKKASRLLAVILKSIQYLPSRVVGTSLLYKAWFLRRINCIRLAKRELKIYERIFLSRFKPQDHYRYFSIRGCMGIGFEDRKQCLHYLQQAAQLVLKRGDLADYFAAVNSQMDTLMLLDEYRVAEKMVLYLKKNFLRWKHSAVPTSTQTFVFCNQIAFYARLGVRREVDNTLAYLRFQMNENDLTATSIWLARGRLAYLQRNWDEAFRNFSAYIETIKSGAPWREDLHQLIDFFRIPLFQPALRSRVNISIKPLSRQITRLAYEETRCELLAIKAAEYLQDCLLSQAGRALANLRNRCYCSEYLRLNFQVDFYSAVWAAKSGYPVQPYLHRARACFNALMKRVPEQYRTRYKKDPLFGSFLAGKLEV